MMSEPPPPGKCFRMNAEGELPTCAWDGQRWSASYDGFGDFGGGAAAGPPSGFVALLVLGLLVGLGLTVWRVMLARQVARQSGMSENQATAVTLLGDNGLEATYLAGNLRSRPAAEPPPAPGATAATAPVPRTAEARLRELQELRDEGLLTPEEYDARRTAVLDSV